MRHRISGASWPEATKGSHNRWWPPWLAREPGNLCAILQMGKPQWWRMGPWIQINLIFLKIKERNISCDTWFERMRSTCFQIPRKKTREGCLQQLAHSGYSWGEERDCLRRKAGTSTFILTPLYCLNFWHWIPITFVCFFFLIQWKSFPVLHDPALPCLTMTMLPGPAEPPACHCPLPLGSCVPCLSPYCWFISALHWWPTSLEPPPTLTQQQSPHVPPGSLVIFP